jgi:hypothetical protein
MNANIDGFVPEAMFQHFWNEEGEWCSFDASSPEDMGLKEGSLIEDAELSGSDEGKWCTTYRSVPEVMPKKTGDSKPLGETDLNIDAFPLETMFQHLRKEEAEWCSFDASPPEDVGLEESSLIEEAELSGSDDGKWCTTYLSVPEAMPYKTCDHKPYGETDSESLFPKACS